MKWEVCCVTLVSWRRQISRRPSNDGEWGVKTLVSWWQPILLKAEQWDWVWVVKTLVSWWQPILLKADRWGRLCDVKTLVSGRQPILLKAGQWGWVWGVKTLVSWWQTICSIKTQNSLRFSHQIHQTQLISENVLFIVLLYPGFGVLAAQSTSYVRTKANIRAFP